MNWAREIKIGIDNYYQQVVPLVNEGFYEVAGMEMGNVLFMLNEKYREIPNGTIKTYAFGLAARLELFRDYCLDESLTNEERERRVRGAMDRIEERIHLVEIGAKSFLED